MKQDWAALKEENEILSKLASHDWLTSIYNRGATETKINQLLAEKKTGRRLTTIQKEPASWRERKSSRTVGSVWIRSL